MKKIFDLDSNVYTGLVWYVVAPCNGYKSWSAWETGDDAKTVKDAIDKYGCGGNCGGEKSHYITTKRARWMTNESFRDGRPLIRGNRPLYPSQDKGATA